METQKIKNDEMSKSTENTVSTIAVILLLIGIIGFLILGVIAEDENDWVLGGIAIGLLFWGVITWCVLKMLSNISKSLKNRN